MTLLDQSLEKDLQDHLLALPYPAFVQVIKDLLERMDYKNVERSARSSFIGRHRDGGYDLLCELASPLGNRRVIVQVKQYPMERPIFRRSIDELRGVALRAQASEAILITTSSFSESVPKARFSSGSIVPVRLIDGRALSELLAMHRLGVWEETGGSPSEPARRGVDTRYFAEIEEMSLGNTPATGKRLTISFSITLIPRSKKSPETTKTAALPHRS